jgi:predicted nuclease with TOPRIM domain
MNKATKTTPKAQKAVKPVTEKKATKSKTQKPKAPTLKEQVNNWKGLYATLSEDYNNLLSELSHKDMELEILRSERNALNHQHHHDISDYQILKERYAILENTYFDLLERHNTPWYTKLLNFFKGD